MVFDLLFPPSRSMSHKCLYLYSAKYNEISPHNADRDTTCLSTTKTNTNQCLSQKTLKHTFSRNLKHPHPYHIEHDNCHKIKYFSRSFTWYLSAQVDLAGSHSPAVLILYAFYISYTQFAKRLYTLVVPMAISMYKRKYIYMHSYNGATAGSTVVRLIYILKYNHII